MTLILHLFILAFIYEAEKAIEAIGAKIKNLKELIALRQETIDSRRSLADHTETRASEMSIHYSNFD